MIKKKRRTRSSTASSSSEQMDGLKPPSDVLALGKRIVRELELEPGVDTLGRWLAHHLAEVISAAENTEDPKREAAQSKAVKLILKVWSRRHDMRGRANPVKDLDKAVAILRLLQPDASPFGHVAAKGPERLLKKAFEGLQHIIAYGVTLASGTVGKTVDLAEAKDFVGQDEAYAVEAMNTWSAILNAAQTNFAVSLRWLDDADLQTMQTELEEISELTPEAQGRQVFAKQVDQLVKTLNELKAALGPE